MDSFFVGIVVVPGVTAVVLLLLFTYLHQQSRDGYFRAWQIAWVAYTLFYLATGVLYLGHGDGALYLTAKLLQIFTVLAILASTRLIDEEPFQLQWYDAALFVAGLGYSGYLLTLRGSNGQSAPGGSSPRIELEILLAIVLLVAAVKFYRYGRQKDY